MLFEPLLRRACAYKNMFKDKDVIVMKYENRTFAPLFSYIVVFMAIYMMDSGGVPLPLHSLSGRRNISGWGGKERYPATLRFFASLQNDSFGSLVYMQLTCASTGWHQSRAWRKTIREGSYSLDRAATAIWCIHSGCDSSPSALASMLLSTSLRSWRSSLTRGPPPLCSACMRHRRPAISSGV